MLARFRAPSPFILLGVLGCVLATPVLTTPGMSAGVATTAVVAAVTAFAWRADGRAAWVAVGALALYELVAAFNPVLRTAVATRLAVEAAAAFLPLVAFVALRRRALALSPHPTRTARGLLGFAVALAGLGTALRIAGVYLVWSSLTVTRGIIPYALRYDAAASLWALAAAALAAAAFSLAAHGHAPPRKGIRRMIQRHMVATAMCAAVLLVAVDAGSLATAGAPVDGDRLAVGYHANHVDDVPEAASIVHLEAAWSRMGRPDGTYDWGHFEEKLDAAHARGLDVYLLVSAYPPRWFTESRPESVMVDREGDPFYWIDEPPGQPKRRVWEVSFADPVARDAKRAFVQAAVAEFAPHPAVKTVAVLNEPAFPVDWNLLRWASFDPFTLQAFRDTLANESAGSLAVLNDEYGTHFASWDEVTPRAHPFGAFGERWLHFREDLLIDYVRDMMDAARSETDKPLTTKLMAHFLTRFAEPQAGLSDRVNREIAAMCDVVSVDLYPLTKSDLVRSLRYFRAIAGDKPLVVAEFNLALGLNVPGAGLRLLGAFDAMDEYADAVILFTATGNHYLYGATGGTPGLAVVQLYAARGQSFEERAPLAGALVREEVENLLAFPARAAHALGLAGALLKPKP